MSHFSIPILIQETAGYDRKLVPVRLGVPLPRGAVRNCNELGLQDPKAFFVPLQKRALARWPDQTVKWVLIDFLADVPKNRRLEYILMTGVGHEKPQGITDGIAVSQQGNDFTVDTKTAVFTVCKTSPGLLSSVYMQDVALLKSGKETEIKLTGTGKDPCYMETQRLILLESGPLRCCLRAAGRWLDSRRQPYLNFVADMSFFAGLSRIRLDLQIHNPNAALHPGGAWDLGGPGSIFFKDLSLYYNLDADPSDTNISYSLFEDPVPMDYLDIPGINSKSARTFSSNPLSIDRGIERNSPYSCTVKELGDNARLIMDYGHQKSLKADHELLANRAKLPGPSRVIIYQDSSGGENWNSANHIDHTGSPSIRFRGFQVSEGSSGLCEVTSEGLRAVPYVKLATHKGWLAAVFQDFWQNFPKALELRDNILRIGLFPKEATGLFELQGGEKKRHTLLLEFGLNDQDSCLGMQHPLHVCIDPDWIEKSETISYFVTEQGDQNEDYQSYIRNVIDGPNSFFRKREKVDEFGWRNFGDIYADHEAMNHRGPGDFVSHYNNQYDFVYGALVHFLRTGDKRWQELAYTAAKHTIDIDIYHTDDDKSAYNHGLFWHTDHYRKAATCTHRTYSRKNACGQSYGGGPANEHNYTSGLLLYHYLTGDSEAADAVLALAEWVLAMDDGRSTVFGWFDEGPTGLASQTAAMNYHKPGRGAGNSVNSLMDAYKLTNDRKYMAKAEELIQRCIHPEDDIYELGLDNPEYRWSYLVFLQMLGKYLDLKAELNEMDYLCYYARDSLLHYSEWMAENEVPYKDILHKVEIPTETWPAQDMRKCWVFHLAEKYGPPIKRDKYSERAGYFFQRSLDDLLSFDTAYFARPMVILAVCGYIHGYFKKNKHQTFYADHGYDFGKPTFFIPQKVRIKISFRKKITCTKKIIGRYFAEQVYRARTKLRRV